MESESGEMLGRVRDFDLDVDSQSILKYYVTVGNLIKKLTFAELIIHRSQVVSINGNKMIVRDVSIDEKIKTGEKTPMPAV